jgi:hypothetical protein
MQVALAHLAGVPSPTAQAVFNGVRTDAAISYINRIADAQEWPQFRRDEFAAFSGKIGELNKLRNDILHFGARWSGASTWTVSNAKFIHSQDRLREFPISIESLEDVISDIDKIEAHLEIFIWGDAFPPGLRETYEQERIRPWRYRPPQPSDRRSKTPKVPRKSKRPPESSGA